MTLPRRVHLVLDQVRTALPLVAVAGLAAYTWWLVQSVPGLGMGQQNATAPSTPDYILGDATVERFDPQGQRVSVMRGDAIVHYMEGDRLEVRQLRLVAQDPQGQVLQATAREGRYGGDSAVIDLVGGARVVATGGTVGKVQGPATFEGEVLSINTRTRQLRSNRPVLLTTPQGTVRGSTLSYDATQGFTTMGGRVSGRLTTARPSAPAQPATPATP